MRHARAELGLPLALAVLALAGCGGPEEIPMCEVRTSLVDHNLWVPVPVERDPFAADGEVCDFDHMRAELLGTELSWTIETRGCRWGSLEQPIPFAVRAGETLNFRLWFFS